ncbi:MAG TPA: DUF6448 family protein [Nitrospirota bacterium]|nr:DUF6448 family protein [Nitrospirota bacterium]
MERNNLITIVLFMMLSFALWSLPLMADAHCDTMDGPVVNTARMALEKGDVTPVLKWVRKEDEKEIKEQFQKTLAARKQGREAKELADNYFFETLVRIHRAGEGAPYTGLKSGSVEPIIQAADKALETGLADPLVKQVTDAAAKGLRERFERLKETKKRSDESVEKGREFVAAYVEFTHFVERLYAVSAAPCPCGRHTEHHGSAPETPRHHEH